MHIEDRLELMETLLGTDGMARAGAQEIRRLKAENEELREENTQLREALRSAQSWIFCWTNHVGNCKGGNHCTCGRTFILFEGRQALREAK